MTWHPDIPQEYRNSIVTGDARELAKRLPDESVDFVITDPPYGIGIARLENIGAANGKANSHSYRKSNWDDKGLTVEQFREIKRVSEHQIIFGFNHLSHVLPPTSGVIVWDKKEKNGWFDNFSDCEIAWTSLDMPARMYRHLWMGACRRSETGKGEGKLVPTQKPLNLMLWIVNNFTKPNDIILDPFAGGGTTVLAAKLTGRNYIAFEIDPDTAELARERVANTQPPLFTTEPQEEQLELSV